MKKIEEVQPDIKLPKMKRIRVYTALLTNDGTNAPIATVLQNTLGEDVIWTRQEAGKYKGTCGEFAGKTGKMSIMMNNLVASGTTGAFDNEDGTIGVFTAVLQSGSPIIVYSDNLYYTTVEIRIYE